MDQNDSNSGWNAGNSGNAGTTGSPSGGFGTGSTGSMGGGFGTSSSDTGTTGTSGFGVSSASETSVCPHCGQSMNKGGLEQLLGRLGINDEMLNNLKGQFQNVDIDEYLNTAREYLKGSSTKAGSFAKENPGKVAAGVAALALGAGLIYAAVNRDKA